MFPGEEQNQAIASMGGGGEGGRKMICSFPFYRKYDNADYQTGLAGSGSEDVCWSFYFFSIVGVTVV